ncbi:hypothetical protein DFR53_1887 [Pontivivens insulae]|nr:hypothetical protein DFR53_1887 [Pontivivens insulae]
MFMASFGLEEVSASVVSATAWCSGTGCGGVGTSKFVVKAGCAVRVSPCDPASWRLSACASSEFCIDPIVDGMTAIAKRCVAIGVCSGGGLSASSNKKVANSGTVPDADASPACIWRRGDSVGGVAGNCTAFSTSFAIGLTAIPLRFLYGSPGKSEAEKEKRDAGFPDQRGARYTANSKTS